MKITKKWWFFLVVAAFVAFGAWYRLGYPRFSIIHFTVGKTAAVSAAETYLRARGVDPAAYERAITFESDFWPDRYLQKTLKLDAAERFIREHGYEIFTWRVRFFRELQKEEYVVELSPRTGAVVVFQHKIEDIEPRPYLEEDAARAIAERFLSQNCGHDFETFTFHEKKIKKFENRTDYTFSWEKKGVYIPWRPGEGGAKLLTRATVSGDEVREYYVQYLDVPEKFERYIEKQSILGQALYTLHFLVFITLVGCSVALVVKRRTHAVIRNVKKWYLWLAVCFAAINLTYLFNNTNLLFAYYQTSSTISSYVSLFGVKMFTDVFFTTIMFLVPAIAGESTRREVYPDRPQASLAHNVMASFFTRDVAASIVLGYLFCVILLGTQAVVFYCGQKYLGVWREWIKMAQFSSAFIPALGVFSSAASASLTEETVYRMFGITFSKKFLGRTFLAVVLTSLLWGFGHSEYPIYPVWFRGLEVGFVGILFGYVYLRFGLVTVLVAHYLFDCFWGIAPHIISHTTVPLFSQAIFLFLIPLLFAAVAFVRNRPDVERAGTLSLDNIQAFNVELLVVFLYARKAMGVSSSDARNALLAHNWDVELVDRAINRVYGS